MTEGCSWALVRSLSIRTFFSCLPDLGRWGCWANGAVYSLKLGSRPAFLEVLPRSDWARYCASWHRSQRAARRRAVNFTIHSKSVRFICPSMSTMDPFAVSSGAHPIVLSPEVFAFTPACRRV